MTTPQQQIESDVKAALKAGEKTRLATLRMLLGDLKNRRIELGGEVGEEDFLALVRKGIKRREDAASQYRQGGREDRAAQEETEAAILAGYLPPQVDEATIRAAIREHVAAEGLEGMKGMGSVMQAMKGRFGAQADGATLSRIAREILTQGS